MDLPPAPRPPRPTRRSFLVTASAAAGLAAAGATRAWGRPATARQGGEPAAQSSEGLPGPVLTLPAFTRQGAKVPLSIETSHPMQPDHFITRIHVANAGDPVPSKGVFHFSPLNGQAYLACQIRVDHGTSEVSVTAECNRHGRWRTTGRIAIPEGAGGCAGTAPPPGTATAEEIRPPAIRIPQLVADGRIGPDQIIDVQIKTRHPSRTGLVVRDGAFVPDSEPLYLERVDVSYAAQPVCRFALTSALSDNPLITFRLRAHAEGLLRAVLTNNRGQRFEATHPIRFA
jgi:desulfoferrodoxin (superoxide reductase-like protein)